MITGESGRRRLKNAYPTISVQHADTIVEHLCSFYLVDSDVLRGCGINVEVLGELVVVAERLMEAIFEVRRSNTRCIWRGRFCYAGGM